MLSRRQFLQAAGIALSAAHLPRLNLTSANAAPAHSFEALYGRALATVPVYAAPQANAPLSYLWSDTVVPILDSSGEWYRLPDGYARREGLQPLLEPAQTTPTDAAPPFWGEVTGAVAVIRAWCTANAPMVTRVGHGGVLFVADRLTLDGIDWLGVANDEHGALIGWSQAAAWSLTPEDTLSAALTLHIDRAAQRLTAYDADQPVLTAPAAAQPTLSAGTFPIQERRLTLPSERAGTPWALRFGANQRLTGAYWHNRFGSAFVAPDASSAVEVAPALARWLYPRAAEIIIS